MTASNDSTPVWFITGCSTGFGRELAAAVLKRGWCAVLTARNPATLADLLDAHPQQAVSARLDVTRAADIEAAVRQAYDAFGRIDVLVNNAGYGYLAAVEEGEDTEVRAMFEANFFGAVNMIKAVLPAMRERRAGHIVNVTSVGGFVGNPSSAYYAATKFALEGLSESLTRETAELGIKVTAVEPGPFRTDWAGRSLKQTSHPIEDYASIAGKRRTQVVERSGRQPGNPARAAEAIIAAVQADVPPHHLVLGSAGLEMVRGKLARVAADLDTWESTSVWTDDPLT
jgi:NAD(P)-dependent dehydrogenase (short-subunit alcohol dehydrogenase family)